MWKTWKIALRTVVVMFILTGLIYPLAMTALAQMLFPHQANGSLVSDERGQVIGSALIGQRFQSPAYFHPRPSAAGADGYDGRASSASNLGPTSSRLKERVAADVAKLRQSVPADSVGTELKVPAELVTASASGLDPHLSPDAARWQIARVAQARGVAPVRLQTLVEEQIEGRELGFIGEPRVNVLQLNLALDRLLGRPTQSP